MSLQSCTALPLCFESAWFTAEVSLAWRSCADSAGPAIILSWFLPNWLLQGSNWKTWKRNVLSNPSLLVSPSSWQICCSCTHGHGGARFPCLQALGVQCVCELVRVLILLLSPQTLKLLTFQLSTAVQLRLSVMFHFTGWTGFHWYSKSYKYTASKIL